VAGSATTAMKGPGELIPTTSRADITRIAIVSGMRRRRSAGGEEFQEFEDCLHCLFFGHVGVAREAAWLELSDQISEPAQLRHGFWESLLLKCYQILLCGVRRVPEARSDFPGTINYFCFRQVKLLDNKIIRFDCFDIIGHTHHTQR
jgi:hypothetical protein